MASQADADLWHSPLSQQLHMKPETGGGLALASAVDA
jgi:hypothetical protein